MDAKKVYKSWLENPLLDDKAKAELLSINDDEREIEERFYKDLSFGTAGLRGILGIGSNRMNFYNVAAAAEGFASYIEGLGEDAAQRGIAISYDSRHYSPEFAELAARVFVSHGIKVRLSDELRPVPLLSYAIRHYNCVGGIMITASHNPKIYNGFKAYGEDGGQIPVAVSDKVSEEIAKIPDRIEYFYKIPPAEEAMKTEFWHSMGEELDKAYDDYLLGLSINAELVKEQHNLSIIYSPLHGSGNKPVRRILKKLGFTNVTVVPEQEHPDGDFPTAPYPNPEDRAALEMGIALAEEKQADLLIATDPDADRMGVALRKTDGKFVVLSGNQIGILLMDYVLSSKNAKDNLSKDSYVVSTVVSSRLPDLISESYGVRLFRTLTGFKNIAEVIKDQEEQGNTHFEFAYEESFGYLSGREVRDKDAVVSSMLMAELAATAASIGESIYDRLERIYEEHGFAAEKTISLVREGKAGQEQIANAMATVRANKKTFFDPLNARRIYDLQDSTILDVENSTEDTLALNKSNVLVFELKGQDWFATRPSGTEPKLKIYLGCYRETKADAEAALQKMEHLVADKIKDALDA